MLVCQVGLGVGFVILSGCFCLSGFLYYCLSLMLAAIGLLGSRSSTRLSLNGIIVMRLVDHSVKMLKSTTA